MLRVSIHCDGIKAKLAGMGWDNPPGGARNFPQLYGMGNVKGGIKYVGRVVDTIEAR